MNHKLLFLTVALIALLTIAGAFWLMQKRQVPTIPSVVTDSAVETPVQQVNSVTEGAPDKQTFVTDVDPDVSHWQTKETEFFTIKFPKEWYWLESVITNNPNFEIDRYTDIRGEPITSPLRMVRRHQFRSRTTKSSYRSVGLLQKTPVPPKKVLIPHFV
jgi:hypothetical protein